MREWKRSCQIGKTIVYVSAHSKKNFGWESKSELALDEFGAHCLFEDNKRQIGLENKILGGKREDTFIHRSKILNIFFTS